jgi:hypothetical protein
MGSRNWSRYRSVLDMPTIVVWDPDVTFAVSFGGAPVCCTIENGVITVLVSFRDDLVAPPAGSSSPSGHRLGGVFARCDLWVCSHECF